MATKFTEEMNVQKLSNELSSVSNWYQLGIKLGLQPYQLRQIEKEHPAEIERCKVEMLDLWQRNNPGATWRHIVTALKEMGELTTAERIQMNYVKGAASTSVPSGSGMNEDFAKENRQSITAKFAGLQMKVCDKLSKNGVDIEQFLLFLAALFPPGYCIPPAPTILTKVFEAITHHGLWDCLHYSPLVQIVQRFGAGDPEMKTWIQDYKKDLKAYTIVESIEHCIESDLFTDQSRVDRAKYDPRYNCPVEWKMKMDLVEHSLQYLTNVWEMFSGHYLVPDSPPTALLDRVRKGCISVTWLVPSHLIPQLIERAKTDTKFFLQHDIQKVIVGDEIVYEEQVAAEESTAEERPPSNNLPEPHVESVSHNKIGGYDCDFVEPPPSVLQTQCPICHLTLREPYEVTCCGTVLCHSCLQRLQADKKPCPTCREDFESYHNKSMERSLNGLHVYCTHRAGGCGWSGELGKLHQHLNKDCSMTTVRGETPTNESDYKEPTAAESVAEPEHSHQYNQEPEHSHQYNQEPEHSHQYNQEPEHSNQYKPPGDYFDILLLGRTGMGKSTTGNKLLNIKFDNNPSIKQWSSKTSKELLNSDGDKHFLQADEIGDPTARSKSVTKQCELLSNESESYRVFDIPGFADSERSREFGGVYRANLEIMRQIVRVQMEQGLEFNRVLYFLPERGILEKSHAVLQEEIKVMHRFFGTSIFNNMILITTWHLDLLEDNPNLTMSPKQIMKVEEIFKIALNGAIEEDTGKSQNLSSPPAVYVSFSETTESLRAKVHNIYSIEPEPLSLKFRKDICAKCAARIRKVGEMEEEQPVVFVYDKEGNPHNESETNCHPFFYPKYTEIERIVGGILYIATLGIPLAVRRALHKKPLWPTFTSYDEICVECKKPPGSEGCTPVNTNKQIKLQSGQEVPICVAHSSEFVRIRTSSSSEQPATSS